VLSNLAVVARTASAAAAAPLNYLGRNSLPVFAAGSVICIFLQVIKSIHPTSVPLDLVLLSGGLALQYAAAAAGSYRLPSLLPWVRA
jgi:hypothetical protein